MSLDRLRPALFYNSTGEFLTSQGEEKNNRMPISIAYAVPNGKLVFDLRGRSVLTGYAYARLDRNSAHFITEPSNSPLLEDPSKDKLTNKELAQLLVAIFRGGFTPDMHNQAIQEACLEMNDKVTSAIQAQYTEYRGVEGSYIALSQRGRLQLFARIHKGGLMGNAWSTSPNGQFPAEDYYHLTEPQLKAIGIGLHVSTNR